MPLRHSKVHSTYGRDALRILRQRARHLLSTQRRQTGILVVVHSVLRESLKLKQPQLSRFGPNGQPIESSQLVPARTADVIRRRNSARDQNVSPGSYRRSVNWRRQPEANRPPLPPSMSCPLAAGSQTGRQSTDLQTGQLPLPLPWLSRLARQRTTSWTPD